MSSNPPALSLVATLVSRYDDLVDHLRRRFGDGTSAHDVVHDIYLRLVSDPPAAQVRTPFAFLRRAATHLAIDRYRVEQARAAWVSTMTDPPDVPSEAPDAGRALDANRRLQALARTIESLPPRCREVFVMHKIDDVPQPEVAARLGISRNMVEKHVMHGLAACREALAPSPARTPARRSARRRAAGSAAVLAICAACVLWLDPAYRTERYATQPGERRDAALADGSRVLLNTGSDVEVSWRLRSRELRLRQGEALFEVARSVHRPFVVHANGGAVEVTGTAFNVRLEARGARVTVVEGSVRVRDAGTAVALTAGEEIAWSDGRLSGAPARVQPGRSLAWRQGKLVFENTPLKAVLAEIQRYRAAPIVLHDNGIGELELTGVYDVDRTDELLELLPSVLPVRVTAGRDGRIDVRPAGSR